MGMLMNIAKSALSSPEARARAEAEEGAELAVRALAFLAQDMEQVERFLSLTGVDPADIRRLAGQRDFQLAVLDHLAGDETLLLAFAAAAGVAPEAIGRARFALGGGERA